MKHESFAKEFGGIIFHDDTIESVRYNDNTISLDIKHYLVETINNERIGHEVILTLYFEGVHIDYLAFSRRVHIFSAKFSKDNGKRFFIVMGTTGGDIRFCYENFADYKITRL